MSLQLSSSPPSSLATACRIAFAFSKIATTLELAVDCDEVSVLDAFVRLKLKVCITKHIDRLVKPYRRAPALIIRRTARQERRNLKSQGPYASKAVYYSRYLAPDLLKQLLPFIQAFNVTAYCF
jgi:hypothetical protein